MMLRRCVSALLLGAGLCAPLSAAARTIGVAAPVAAPLGLPSVTVSFPVAPPGPGLTLPTLPGAASLLLPGLPAPAALSLPTPAAAPSAAPLPAARRLSAPAGLAFPEARTTAETEARPAGLTAALQTARTLPRLVFDGGLGAAPSTGLVPAGPEKGLSRRPALSRFPQDLHRPAVAALTLPLPAQARPERPGILKRLRASAWGVVLGFTALGAGAALMLTPGPGTPLILVGLYLLSGRFTWAREGLEKVLSFVKDKVFHGDRKRLAKLKHRLGI